MSEDINNLLGVVPKGQMSAPRPEFVSHGSCPSVTQQFFNFCDPPSRQHAAFATSKAIECAPAAGAAPLRKNSWHSDALTVPLDHGRNPAVGKSTAAAPPALPPPHPATGEAYPCCKPTPHAPGAWEPYPLPPNMTAAGRGVRHMGAAHTAVATAPAGALPHPLHAIGCYGLQGPVGALPPPPPPGVARPPLAPRHPGAAPPPPPPQSGVHVSRPPAAAQGHGYPPHPHPHHTTGPQPGAPPAPPSSAGTCPSSTPAPPPSGYGTTAPVAAPTPQPPPVAGPVPVAPPPPPAVWPWPWPHSQPMPPMSDPPPPPGAAQAGAGGAGNSGRAGAWRLEDDQATEDALQELLLEEIAAAPWPHMSIPSLRAAGVLFDNYGRFDPSMVPHWQMGPSDGMPQPPMGSPWTTAAADGSGAGGGEPAKTSSVSASTLPAVTSAAWESMSGLLAPPVPQPMPPQPPHHHHHAPAQLSSSSIPAVPVPPMAPPLPLHLSHPLSKNPSSQPQEPPQPQSAAPDAAALMQQQAGMMEMEMGLQSRNDDALFAAWLTDMGCGPGRDGGGGGGYTPAGGPLAAPTGWASAAATATAAQQDSGFNRASFANSPTSASMPTTPTMTTGRPRADMGCGGGGGGGGGFSLSASASASAAVSSQQQQACMAVAAAAAAAAAAAVAPVAVVAAVEATTADGGDAMAEAGACGGGGRVAGGGDGAAARLDDEDMSDDGEGEAVSGAVKAAGAAAGGPRASPGGGVGNAALCEGNGIIGGAQAASLREQIYSTFDLPVADAARVLGISATELKRRCRRLGISRWPQRKLQSLRRIVQAAESDASLTEEERKAVMELAARNRHEIMADPDAPLVDLLKTVRQTQYKQSFEKRAAAAAANRRVPAN